MRIYGNRVDGKGGVKDIDKLPPQSEWGAERFEIFLYNPTPSASSSTVSLDSSFPSDYEIISQISEGYWGKTYKVKSRIDCNFYCVKMFNSPMNHQTLLSFNREMKALVNLPKHPNIISYNHSTVVNNINFIICEYIHSNQLLQELPSPDGTKEFNEKNLIEWISQILQGLRHLHESNPCIIHRDLHMGNILVRINPLTNTPDTRPGSIKIVDVGNAAVSEDRNNLHRSNVGGTHSYFSPERLESNEYNEKDDIWAVAVITTELVTGKLVSRRPNCGSNGCLFASNSRQSQRNAIIEEVNIRSSILSSFVRAIFSLNNNHTVRLSAKDLLKRFFITRSVSLSFCCPITMNIMEHPVICSDGHTYERNAISEWLISHRTSPMTNQILSQRNLIPNHALRSLIADWSVLSF